MVAHRARDQNRVARAHPGTAQLNAVGQHADTGGGDENAVALATLDHLGVARHHRHTRRVSGMRHRLHDTRQVTQRKALFQNKTCCQIQRRGTHHGHVVERAVHRQTADITARKKQRRHHMAVGGHHQPRRFAVDHRGRQHRTVVTLAQVGVAQVAGKQLRDELHHGPPARAVRHVNAPVFQIKRPHVATFDFTHGWFPLRFVRAACPCTGHSCSARHTRLRC